MHGRPCEIYPPASFNPSCPPPNIPRCTVDSSGAPIPVTSSGSNGPSDSSTYDNPQPSPVPTPTDPTQSQGPVSGDAQVTDSQGGADSEGGLLGATAGFLGSSAGTSGVASALSHILQPKLELNDWQLRDLIRECEDYRRTYCFCLELHKRGEKPLDDGSRRALEKAIVEIDQLSATVKKARDRNWLRRFLTSGEMRKQVERFRIRRQQIVQVTEIHTSLGRYATLDDELHKAKIRRDAAATVLKETNQQLAEKNLKIEKLTKELALSQAPPAPAPSKKPTLPQVPSPEPSTSGSGRRARSTSLRASTSTPTTSPRRSPSYDYDDNSDYDSEYEGRQHRRPSSSQRQSRPQPPPPPPRPAPRRQYRQADYEEDEYTYTQPRRRSSPPARGNYYPRRSPGPGPQLCSIGSGNVVGNNVSNVGNVSSFNIRSSERRPPPPRDRRQQRDYRD